jgi:hypothetical protein
VAVAGRYDQQAGRVMIELDSGLEIAFRPQHAQGLEACRFQKTTARNVRSRLH